MASFAYAARYRVTASCVTPLRSGGTDVGPDFVLCRRDGQIFLQGTSLAGVLRGWLADSGERDLADRLFGSPDQASPLFVSDGEFSPESVMQTRPRLRIDGKTGSAANKAKFDVAHMAVGSQFTFTLTWTALEPDDAALSAIERILAALHNGEIRLGAQKTNGFGRVSLQVIRQEYHLRSSAADRAAWMEDSEKGEPLELARVSNMRQIVFTVTGYTNSILVKAAAVKLDQKTSFTANITENNRAVLPGSSMKGAVRARADSIAKLLQLDENIIDDIFGRGAKEDDNGKKDDNGKAGLIRFQDAVLPEAKQTISRIRIDKFTGGVLGTSLFQEEPHSGRLTWEISVPHHQPAACALLLFALRDLGLGFYNLGSGWAIGRGRVALQEIAVQTPAGGKAVLRFGETGNCTVEDSQNIIKDWIRALELEAVKREN